MVTEDTRCNVLVVLGATATGKTALAVYLARELGAEIISADSRQVYRGLDIGSGKDLGEYGDIPYHLVDVASLPDEYSVFHFQKDFFASVQDIQSRSSMPLVCGGTGLYLDSVIRGYEFREVPVNPLLREELSHLSVDELARRLLSLKQDIHNKTDLLEKPRLVRAIEIAEYIRLSENVQCSNTFGRPVIRVGVLGIRFERAELRNRIEKRLDQRLEQGMVEEVASLQASGISWERLERLGLEYRFTAEFLQKKIPSFSEYRNGLYTAICQFAKRQETWFRGMERKGVRIEWVENGNRGQALSIARRMTGRHSD